MRWLWLRDAKRLQAIAGVRLRRSLTRPSTPRRSAIAAVPDPASISGAAAIAPVAATKPSKLMVAFPEVVMVTTSVIANGLLVVVELVPDADQGSPEAISVFSNVSVPNIVLELEI